MASRNNKRALTVLRFLRARQQRQTEQIDILCRDVVAAHRDFSVKLAQLNFVSSFYETLLGCADLETLLDASVDKFRQAIDGADAAIFLLGENGFDVHIADSGLFNPIEKDQFQNWFTPRLVNNISRMNRVCSLDQLLRMGLQGPPAIMKTISAAAVPLGRIGQGTGFVFVYRPAHLPLQPEELAHAAAVSIGLREAIGSFNLKNLPSPEKKGLSV
ncbi:MAG: hypothetical protein L0Y36_03270 [Planctomycetales bacterium]|nr:hypothetical protein [Planctomycetales bacterium]